MPCSWGSRCSGWSFCKVLGELLPIQCSSRRPASPWSRRLPPLAEPAECCWILQPGFGLRSCCSKSLWLLARSPRRGCNGGLQPACSPLLRSLCWASALGLTTVPPTGTDAKPVGKLGAGELAPTSPRDAASLEGGVPSASLAGAMQTGWLQRSRRS